MCLRVLQNPVSLVEFGYEGMCVWLLLKRICKNIIIIMWLFVENLYIPVSTLSPNTIISPYMQPSSAGVEFPRLDMYSVPSRVELPGR